MTKKRFIKLLVSHGEPIHRARKIASLYNASNIPYKKAYYNYITRKAFSRLAKAAAKVGNSLRVATASLRKFTEAMKK